LLQARFRKDALPSAPSFAGASPSSIVASPSFDVTSPSNGEASVKVFTPPGAIDPEDTPDAAPLDAREFDLAAPPHDRASGRRIALLAKEAKRTAQPLATLVPAK
jgi:hypothetical protein